MLPAKNGRCPFGASGQNFGLGGDSFGQREYEFPELFDLGQELGRFEDPVFLFLGLGPAAEGKFVHGGTYARPSSGPAVVQSDSGDCGGGTSGRSAKVTSTVRRVHSFRVPALPF